MSLDIELSNYNFNQPPLLLEKYVFPLEHPNLCSPYDVTTFDPHQGQVCVSDCASHGSSLALLETCIQGECMLYNS